MKKQEGNGVQRRTAKHRTALPVRLMKPYAGPNYGWHFPLHEGAEVMLGFVGGDPDRPFIQNVMHDSAHPAENDMVKWFRYYLNPGEKFQRDGK